MGDPSTSGTSWTYSHVSWLELQTNASLISRGSPVKVNTVFRSKVLDGKLDADVLYFAPKVMQSSDALQPVWTTSGTVIGNSLPANDNHAAPAIFLDHANYIHLITGAHNEIFKHYSSAKPHNIGGVWKAYGEVNHGTDCASWEKGEGCGTYLGVAVDSRDDIYVVYRADTRQGNRFRVKVSLTSNDTTPAKYQPLVLRKLQKIISSGETSWTPGEEQLLVVPPQDGYSVYHHRVSIDAKDNLYVYFAHWTLQPPLNILGQLRNKFLIMSPDGGQHWQAPSLDSL